MPAGYTLLQSFARTYKQVKDPIGSMEESMKKFNGACAVNLGTRRMIATQDPGFIDHVLKIHHPHRTGRRSLVTLRPDQILLGIKQRVA